jgi:hypothetical protein
MTLFVLCKHSLVLQYITIYFVLSDIDCPLPCEDDFLQQLSNDLEVWCFFIVYFCNMYAENINFHNIR